MSTGWYYHGNCHTEDHLKDAIFSEYPVILPQLSNYYVRLFEPSAFSFNSTTSVVFFVHQIKNYNGTLNLSVSNSFTLAVCEIEDSASAGLFDSIPVQDILVPLFLALFFIAGFGQGRK